MPHPGDRKPGLPPDDLLRAALPEGLAPGQLLTAAASGMLLFVFSVGLIFSVRSGRRNGVPASVDNGPLLQGSVETSEEARS